MDSLVQQLFALTSDEASIVVAVATLVAAALQGLYGRARTQRLQGRIDELEGAETVARLAAAERQRHREDTARLDGRLDAVWAEVRSIREEERLHDGETSQRTDLLVGRLAALRDEVRDHGQG
jgi:hypothetical protein